MNNKCITNELINKKFSLSFFVELLQSINNTSIPNVDC